MRGDYALLKRIMDVAISAALLLPLLPLFVVIAIVIMLESPGPVFFRQARVGKNLQLFSILKFRSMVSDAAAKGPHFTSENDSRITRVGRVLRRTSLDELPQLWNVLIGEMSLIGPRPDTPAQESNYSVADWQARHAVRPGITGLAQVNGRSDITPEARTAFDLAYAAAPSWKQDCSIVQQTLRQVLAKVGVN